ncbi:hypothetical protein BDP27DRAFT_1341675 [Rhodocollybia butyracea]|uniref:Uncharacterized protein n=1 Tax=Rhodocollybia butyracea TaxID=206335 RepID=A0A9P5TZC8_9AGAR|nr:hypothetical protein BDP27DRAFT_1341675 [Rhodocollybia butyracea]
MASLNGTALKETGLDLLYGTSLIIGILPQTTFYGIYTMLFTISTYLMVKQGVDSFSRKLLLGLTVFMYTLTTMYTVVSIANLMQVIQKSLLGFSISNPINLPLIGALFLVNYILTDGVVVWRAWVMCRSEYTIPLFVCIFFLCCAIASEMCSIAIRITISVISSAQTVTALNRAIDITQVSGLGLSLLTNLIATATVLVKAWHLRRMFFSSRPHRPNTSRILVLIVESGVLYSISLITTLVASIIHLPTRGTLGDLYTPVNLQLAGIYPLVVLIMVNKNRTLGKEVTAFSSDSITFTSIGTSSA